MSTSHTPGPWRVGDAGATVFGPPNGNTSPSPATIARVSFAIFTSAEMLANARLIAAAPDLLAVVARALTYQAEAFDNDTEINGADLLEWFSAWRENAKLAIAKAEGRT